MASWKKIGLGGGYLTVELIGNRTIIDTIADIRPGEYQGQPTLEIELLDSMVKVSLNITSCKLLSDAWGEDYEGWRNKTVQISMKAQVVRGVSTLTKTVEPAPKPSRPMKHK